MESSSLRILTHPPLETLLKVAAIYFECFTGPPRFENWQMDSVMDELSGLASSGADFITVTDEFDVMRAFAVGIPMRSYYKRDEFVELGANPDSYVNVALGTLPQYRNQGLGLLLHRKREEVALARGFDVILGRTRADNETQLSLMSKLGYTETCRYTSTFAGSTTERVILTKTGLKAQLAAVVEISKGTIK